MEYTEDFLNKIVTLGALTYPLSKIINVLEIKQEDVAQFTADFDDSESIVAKHFQKGIDISDYSVDIQLFELAKAGNLKAIEMYGERKKLNFEIFTKQKRERKNN
jgi:hypothetical protein